MSRLARGGLLLVALLAAGRPLGAQRIVQGSVDAGAALVRYDGFLPSGAASVTPSVRVAGRRAMLDASVSALFFQSGRSSIGATADGSWLAAAVPHLGRLRFDATAGADAYATRYRTEHALVGARLVAAPSPDATAWLAADAGGVWSRSSADLSSGTAALASSAGALRASGGVGVRGRHASVDGELRAARVGVERLADAVLSAGWRAGPVDADALVGARHARVDQVRGFAEAGVSVRLGAGVALSARGGRYAADPVLGAVAGRFAQLGARVSLGGRRPSAASAPAAAVGLTRLGFEVRALGDGGRELRVRVPGATRVEIMADFTAWEPVALRAVGDERWALDAPVPPGVHRVNVRIDGGAWTVPPGLTAVADEFGGAVGLLVVE